MEAAKEQVKVEDHVEGLDENAHETLDHAAERRITRKFDLWIMPALVLSCLFCFIDRSSIGNARLYGLERDLGMSGYDFNWASTAFFFTYILVEVPSNMALQRFGGRFWLPLLTFSFGLVSFCTAFISNFASLIAMRLLLGLTEGGILPGFAVYLSGFYRKYELVYRLGIFYTSTLLASFFGGFLAAGLVQVPKFGKVQTWRNLYFFEGLVPMFLAGYLYYVLPDSPAKARFLDPEDKIIATQRVEREKISGGEHESRVTMQHIKIAFTSPCNWMVAIMYSCLNVPTQSFFLFLPTIISSMGYRANLANLMSGAPFLAAVGNLLFQTWLSDRIKRRGQIMIQCLPFFALGFALMLAFSTTHLISRPGLRYMALFIAVSLGNVGGPISLGWAANNNPHPAVRAVATAMIVSVGTISAFIASWTYTPNQAPQYIVGHSLNLALSLATVFMAIIIWTYQYFENKKRDRGERDHILNGLTPQQVYVLNDRHPEFRFSY